MKIPISKSEFTQEDMDSILEPLRDGWVVQGPKVLEFESLWSEFTNAKHSIATTSCTTSLFLSLAALDLKSNDEVIVPALSWIATANVVENIGCKTIFCDVDLDTLNLNLKELESKINTNTKAIIPVHLFGNPLDIKRIISMTQDKNIHIIEDAACGFGSYIDETHIGTSGIFGCFSFHPRKAISTGEGGMITTNSEEHALKLRSLRDHGMDYKKKNDSQTNKPYNMLDHSHAGYNFRMTDIQASLGSSQMKRADQILFDRQTIAERYNDAFAEYKDLISLPISESNHKHSYQSYACIYKPNEVVDALNIGNFSKLKSLSDERNIFMEALSIEGIGTRPVTHSIHTLSFYREKYNLKPEDFPKAYAANICGFSLPIFPGLTNEEQNIVIKAVLKYLK